MTMTDTILFVKETQTCHYVLHIATPRLCGEPGFRSRRDVREEAYIRCREILAPEQFERADRTLPTADHPFAAPPRVPKPVIAAPPADAAAGAQDKEKDEAKAKHNEVIRRALEKLVAGGDLKAGEVTIIEDGDDDVIIEFIDYEPGENGDSTTLQTLNEMLRAHGVEVRTDDFSYDSEEDERDARTTGEGLPHVRDEL